MGFEAVHEQLSLMQELGIPFNIHGEIPTLDGQTPVRGNEREGLFYKTEGLRLRESYPGLRIVCEHITTKEAVDFVKKYDNTFATITPQHFMLDDMALNHKAMVNGEWYNYAIQLGFFPSMLCMPVLKNIEHVNALWDAIIWQYENQEKKFFLGTDTAYHQGTAKYSEGCSCGVFNSPVALEMYYMVFNLLNKRKPGIIDDFQRFASNIGSSFYNIQAQPKKIIAIVKNSKTVPTTYGDVVSPFAGQALPFEAIDVTSFV
jgi:dihydroorotase